MIDLHTHTDASDGSFTPAELVEAARVANVTTLAITDHDTFFGYEQALPYAREAGIRLVRGIELTCDHAGGNVHLLAYFPLCDPADGFDVWVERMLESRRERNRKLIARLQDLGMAIALEDVERYGKHLTGRPHFAKAMLDKGYVRTRQEAFDQFLGEEGSAYIPRDVPLITETIARIAQAGGASSLAHPARAAKRGTEKERSLVEHLAAAGLTAIEAYHSDHTPDAVAHYLALAAEFRLAVTGGSDFHGENKPGITLGRGIKGNLEVPASVLADLEARLRDNLRQ